MLAYRIILTVIDSIMMFLLTMFKKESKDVVVVSVIMLIIFAMNIGMIWH